MFKSVLSALSSAIGLKESKAISLTYDEACKRITETEFRRLQEAFKRVATSNTYISKQAFCHEVLSLVPVEIAERVYISCGGSSKGLIFKDLVSLLVVLTKGTLEEKIRFIFSIYASDTLIHKDEFIRFISDVEECAIPEKNLAKLFLMHNSVEFEAFYRWLVDPQNRNTTTITSWLIGNESSGVAACGSKTFTLSDDHETPTFYQVSIAGVTHLSEEDISELETRYWQLQANSHTGKVDVSTLLPLISPPLPEFIVQGFFDAFDENRDGHIDFKEMACGISAAARGPIAERQKFCFKIFDQDKDSLLSLSEQKNMVSIMKSVLLQDMTDSPKDEILMIVTKEDDDLVNELKSNVSQGANMTLEEYLVWSLSNPLPEKFLALVYQICQIVLGLKPQDPCEECDVVTAWLRREENRGIQAGQTWYLISTEWWNSWLHYVSSSALCPLSNSDSGVSMRCSNGSRTGSVASQSNSVVGFSDTSNMGSGSTTSSSKSSSSRCWPKKSNVESTVAMDTSQSVVVTAISTIDSEVDSTPSTLNSKTKCSSSLSLATMDSSRSTCSSSPSPVNSPDSIRKNLSGTSWTGKVRKPGAIENTPLLSSMSYGKVPSLTNEGGRLRKDIEEGRDFKKVPYAIWSALHQWYGGQIPLPRHVIETEKNLELELYPLTLLLYRHQTINTSNKPNSVSGAPWTGMYGAAALSTTISYHNLYPPKRILAFVASFSRKTRLGNVSNFICQKLRIAMQDTRLDLLTSEDLSFHLVLDEEGLTLEELNLVDLSAVLIETRNKDQTWPEEIGSLANNCHDSKRQSVMFSVEKGLTGLNNLGNTCFMNSALQCVSNTKPLTLYFSRKMHMYELNRTNPLGMKGHIAKRYGDLITDIWSGTVKTIAPFKLRWTIGKYAPRFSGFQQNDSQELLAFLLDGLHEDLNRVQEKPYVELKDSDNRPDVICAQEAWENHLLRNKSIIVDLFHGQLKSSVRCKECNQESTRFDPFNYLSLPLPMESQIRIEFKVIRQDGSTPIRYGLLASLDDRIIDVKNRLSELTASNPPKLEPDSLLLTEIRNSRISHIFSDYQRIKGVFVNRPVYVYQINSAGDFTSVQYDPQIQRIMSSAKNQSSPLLRVPVENGHGGGTMGHSRQSSFSSCGSTSMQTSMSDVQLNNSENIIIVVHRKMIRQEAYFLATQKRRILLFGLPLIVPFVNGMTHFDLYKRVWSLVARLVSPLPPTEASTTYNHAQDCDDSLGYQFPFLLRIVMKDAEWCCGICQWYCFCHGCPILCTEDEVLDKFSLSQGKNAICIAIDWDPTALHLRYQTTQEMEHIDHPSVAEAIQKQTESVAFLSCLESFTKEEELNEEEKYNCSKCGGHQLASKKLQIWRLPPILIVHLKRFQLVQGRWTKSHKVVDFPFANFDPTRFLADIPRKTIEAEMSKSSSENCENESDKYDRELYPLQDFHQHRLLNDVNPFQLDYRLYAVVNHSGLMGAGHYISYAKSINGKWFCFNDSSCKEVQEDQIETNTAYMLFYERNGIDCDAYLPRIDPKTIADAITNDDELEAEENELKKVCSVI